MRALIKTELHLDRPNVDFGLVTWFEITIVDTNEQEEQTTIGHARAAIVHVAQALDEDTDLYSVLDAAHDALESMYRVYFFDDSSFREQFPGEGAGRDLLFIEHVTIEPGYQGRNIEFALVRRLCDTLGVGCELAAMECHSDEEVRHWKKMGFEVSPPGRERGAMHLILAHRHPQIVENDDHTGYQVIPVGWKALN